MVFAPSGVLVVLDQDEHAVSVFGEDGAEIARWGGRGEGPGEFGRFLTGGMAVLGEHIAVDTGHGRADVFTLDGQVVASHAFDGLSVSAIAPSGRGGLVVRARASGMRALMEGAATDVVRLDTREVLWSSDPMPGLEIGRGAPVFPPSVQFHDVGSGRIVVGMNDRYDFAVLDAGTGAEIGRIARDVPLRGPDEGFAARFEARFGDRTERLGGGRIPDTFPVTVKMFVGPPGETIWVRRHLAVDDRLAPEIVDAEFRIARLYDLFSSDAYEYLGTVRVPEQLEFMAGDATRLAGVHHGPFGEQSVRVLQFSFK